MRPFEPGGVTSCGTAGHRRFGPIMITGCELPTATAETDTLEHLAQIGGAARADMGDRLVQPALGSLAPRVAQFGQERPFAVHLRGRAQGFQFRLVLDDVHPHLPVVIARQLALADQPVDEVDGAQLLQQAAVEADLVHPVLDVLRRLREYPCARSD